MVTVTRPTLSDEQRDEIRREMGGSALIDSYGGLVPTLDLKPVDFDRLPIQQTIAVGGTGSSEVIERMGRAVKGAGYVVTLSVRPGDPIETAWGQRTSTEGKVIGETAPVRDERLFRLTVRALLSSFAVGIAFGTAGYLLYHSLAWTYIALLVFFLPVLGVTFAIGNLYQSELVAAELRPASPTQGGPGGGGLPRPWTLYLAAGSIQSRERTRRGPNWRHVTKAHEGPSTRANLARVVEKFSHPDSLPLSGTTR